MIRTNYTVHYQYRNLTFAVRGHFDARQVILEVVLDDVTDSANYVLDPEKVKAEFIAHVLQFATDEWKGRPVDDMSLAQYTARVVPDDGVLYKGDGYYIQRPGHPEQLMGPYDTRALATNMAKGFALAALHNTKFPEPTMRFRHSNGNEYTVVGVSNLHSDRTQYPQRVFYQGDNGRTWDKPLEEFMRKMKLIATHEIKPVMTARKMMFASFTDAEGTPCVMREAMVPGTVYLGLENPITNRFTGEPMPPVMAIDKQRARQLLPYLIHFLRTGSMPEAPLGPANLVEAEHHANEKGA